MHGWLQWVLVAGGGWLATATVVGFGLARMIPWDSESVELMPAHLPTGLGASTLEPAVSHRRVLIVDDDAPLRSLLRTTLSSEDFEVRDVGSAEEARSLIPAWRPEIVLLDVNLPRMDGLSLSAELSRSPDFSDTAVILLTGEQISETTARMAGAKTVVHKPFSPLELLSLVRHVVDGLELGPSAVVAEEGQLLIYARDLASIARTERRQRQLLQDAYRETAMALADAVDVRDRATGLHALRVRRYALSLAEAVDPTLLRDPSLEYGFLLHDVGKIGISDQVLLKPGPLTAEERELVHMHPAIGEQILRNVSLLQGRGLDVVRHHHERWDGAGYPDGLSGEQIPLSARIFAVADTLDAMTSHRPYRPALDWTEAVGEIQAQSGRQFDPDVVQAFLSEEEGLRTVYEDLSLVA
jgi:response regulator RpfG family c-di-GMP phosphodiesterase